MEASLLRDSFLTAPLHSIPWKPLTKRGPQAWVGVLQGEIFINYLDFCRSLCNFPMFSLIKVKVSWVPTGVHLPFPEEQGKPLSRQFSKKILRSTELPKTWTMDQCGPHVLVALSLC